jgi:hypothetical protein
MAQRSFQKRAQYQEGRKVRGSRQARAIGKSTRFGRREQEAAWKNAEVDALYKLDTGFASIRSSAARSVARLARPSRPGCLVASQRRIAQSTSCTASLVRVEHR